MDINERTQELGSNKVITYGILFVGVVILFFSQGILTWKSTAARDAQGSVDKIQLEISKLHKEISDSDDADEKKEIEKEIKELKKTDLVDARMEAVSEGVDAKNGIWLWSMARHLGATILALGLVLIGATGSAHERIGALVALALIITRI